MTNQHEIAVLCGQRHGWVWDDEKSFAQHENGGVWVDHRGFHAGGTIYSRAQPAMRSVEQDADEYADEYAE